MQPLRFYVKSLDGDIQSQLECADYPALGAQLLVFDYPNIVRYVVECFVERADVLPHDPFEPLAIILRRDSLVERSSRAQRSIGVDLTKDLVARLEKVGEWAREYITERLTLEISHADFLALCAGSGLNPTMAFDILQFRGIPMAVGEEGEEWNASTTFVGFNPEMCVLYVTFPGGDPMVMDPRFLELTRLVAGGEMTEEEAVGEVCLHAGVPVPVEPALLHAIKNAVSLAAERIMPPYDAAQDLVQVTRASERNFVREVWAMHNEGEAAPRDAHGPFFRFD